MPALNESRGSNETSIGSGHPGGVRGEGGDRGKPSISNDLAASTNLPLFSWLFKSMYSASPFTLSYRLSLSLLLSLPPSNAAWLFSLQPRKWDDSCTRVLSIGNELSICACHSNDFNIRVIASLAVCRFYVVDAHGRTLLIINQCGNFDPISQCIC